MLVELCLCTNCTTCTIACTACTTTCTACSTNYYSNYLHNLSHYLHYLPYCVEHYLQYSFALPRALHNSSTPLPSRVGVNHCTPQQVGGASCNTTTTILTQHDHDSHKKNTTDEIVEQEKQALCVSLIAAHWKRKIVQRKFQKMRNEEYAFLGII